MSVEEIVEAAMYSTDREELQRAWDAGKKMAEDSRIVESAEIIHHKLQIIDTISPPSPR